ncbi:MAG: hypothetical protein RBT62_06390 [Spirochaetia bacterium]|jgi:ribosomal protein S18 acetylase RimI-like enzyme|nr:hypothetical protein [Spirochaetia bacterium]
MLENLEIRVVQGKQDLEAFIQLPATLYARNQAWVPPLWVSENQAYSPGHNAILDRSEHVLLLATRAGKSVGRIVVYIDPQFNAHFGTRTGFFGSFECEDDANTAAALLEAGEAWLAERGMNRVRGPINPVAECWGFLVDGFDTPAVYMSPYNPPYYDTLMHGAGYEGIKDLLAYEADMSKGHLIPDRFRNFEKILAARRPCVTTRMIDTSKLERDAEHIRRILNAGVDGNWGFVPVGRDEMTAVVHDLKPILDPRAIWFVEDSGVPIGCCLGFPDINVIIKRIHGRLFPTGFLRLLTGARRLRDYRLWGLAVLPEYQNLGLDVLMYLRLSDAFEHRSVRMEANYILEDNLKIRNALEKLGMNVIKRYRVYEKEIA